MKMFVAEVVVTGDGQHNIKKTVELLKKVFTGKFFEKMEELKIAEPSELKSDLKSGRRMCLLITEGQAKRLNEVFKRGMEYNKRSLISGFVCPLPESRINYCSSCGGYHEENIWEIKHVHHEDDYDPDDSWDSYDIVCSECGSGLDTPLIPHSHAEWDLRQMNIENYSRHITLNPQQFMQQIQACVVGDRGTYYSSRKDMLNRALIVQGLDFFTPKKEE